MATSIQELEKPSPSASDLAIYESLALRGDISGLKPDQRVRYYADLCVRLGLDPMTQPFLPLRLNGKEVLYASKAATDQLARLHHVTRQVANRERIDDVYLVTVRATLPDGRTEDSIGAVAIGGLKGDALANALMKAESKAKRRACLSILGLGMLEESELESIPAKALESTPAAFETVAPSPSSLTPDQKKRLVGLVKDLQEYGFKKEDLQAKMRDAVGVDSINALDVQQAEEIAGVYEVWIKQLEEAAVENSSQNKDVPF